VPGRTRIRAMTLEDDMAFFEQVPVLAGLGRQALRVLAIGADTKHLPSGAVLHYAGEVPDAAYIVQRGSLLIDPGTFSEGQQYTVGPGTLIGELTLITEHVVPATAIAREPTVLIRLPRSLFRKMLEGYPSAADKLREVLASRLIATTKELNAVKRKLEKK
jgi:CRP-like cAMP-binding protein